MEPITRAQLQNARAAAIAEKKRIAHREQEIKGQLAAEEFYKEVRRIAEVGESTRASSKSMELGVAFDTLLFWTKEHFPDCDVSTEIRHIGYSPTYAVRVDWSERIQPPPLEDLETRRLEKETSW
jgi:hypothetical protein